MKIYLSGWYDYVLLCKGDGMNPYEKAFSNNIRRFRKKGI